MKITRNIFCATSLIVFAYCALTANSAAKTPTPGNTNSLTGSHESTVAILRENIPGG